MYKNTLLLAGVCFMLSSCVEAPPSQPAPPAKLPGQVHQYNIAGIQMVQQADRLIVTISTDVYFVAGTTTVKEERRIDLRNVSEFIKSFSKNYPHSVIKVTGYTDRIFAHKTQLQVSQNYAEAIAAYLFNAGINPKRIAVQGRGASEPIAGEYEPSSAALNRRVVVQIN
jgi:outer membrane protein OmpA-like peptidoglycan-associated protein